MERKLSVLIDTLSLFVWVYVRACVRTFRQGLQGFEVDLIFASVAAQG